MKRSVVLAVVFLCLAGQTHAGGAETVPMWAEGLEAVTPAAIQRKLDAPLRHGEWVFPTRDGRRRTVRTCRGLVTDPQLGPWAAVEGPKHIRLDAGADIYRWCMKWKMLARARPASRNALPELTATRSVLEVLPFMLDAGGGRGWIASQKRANRNKRSWADMIRAEKPEELGIESYSVKWRDPEKKDSLLVRHQSPSGSHTDFRIGWTAGADFDHDGWQDLWVWRRGFPTPGTAVWKGSFVLTRRQPTGPMQVIAYIEFGEVVRIDGLWGGN